MPSVFVYLSFEDYEKYLKIKSRHRGAWSRFIHEAINSEDVIMELMVEEAKKDKKDPMPEAPRLKTKQDGSLHTCQHGFHPEFCRFAMPGKPCE